jgi:hypothetical protein
MASAPSRPQRAPVMSRRSLTRWRQAPSMTPVAIGHPLSNAAGVVQVGLVGQQVRCGGVGGLAFAGVQAVVGGLAADRGGHDPGPAGEDLAGLDPDPLFGVRVAFGVEAPGGLPEVFQDVDEVDHDGHGALAGSGLGPDAVDLVLVSVDQGDSGPRSAGVTPVGFGEPGCDHRRGVVGHAGATGAQPTQRRYAAIHSAPSGGGTGRGRSRIEMGCRN